MKPIDQALQALIQRDPTPEEIAKFYRIKELCGFSDSDSVWSLLLAFGHYEVLYGEIPGKIAQQTRDLLADHKLALEATAGAAERAVKASLIEHVSKTSRDMAERAVETGKILANAQLRRKLAFAIVGSLAVAIPAATLLAYGAYRAGVQSVSGSATRDAAWAQSDQGRAAQRFAALNNVQAMLDCPAQQTRKDGNSTYCIPFDERTNRSYGWRIR